MSDSRSRIWFSLFVLAVFCVGLASGVLLGRRMTPAGSPLRPFLGPPGRIGLPGGPPGGPILDRLSRELSLTPDQRSQIDVVLKASRGRLDAFQEQTRERFNSEQRALRTEIRSHLTAEQQLLFDRWADANPSLGGRRGRAERPPPPGR